jgi:hypothetical protein
LTALWPWRSERRRRAIAAWWPMKESLGTKRPQDIHSVKF